MTFTYDFSAEDDFWGGDTFDYEVEYDEIQKALVEILCKGSKRLNGVLYNEDGNYQMAMYVVYQLDILDELIQYYEDDLKDYFEEEASRIYFESKEY